MSLLAMHPGAAYHCEALEGPRYRAYFDELVRPEALTPAHLARHDIFLIPCRTPSLRVVPHRDVIRAFLDDGGTLIVMGETGPDRWLPDIQFKRTPTNFWWWLEPGGTLGLEIAAPEHALFRRIGPRDLAWHLHGSFRPPAGAESLINDSEGRSILYVDERTTKGRIVVTSLDPFYHHGSHFMPATTKFLDGFLPWITEELSP